MASSSPARDPRTKRLRVLARRRADRAAQGVALVESAVVLGVAIDAGCDVELVVTEPARMTPADTAVVERAAAADAEVIDVAEGVLASLVDARSPQPVAAVVRRPEHDLTSALSSATLAVVTVDLADPGNLGTIVRSAEAAGADVVVAAGSGVDPWSPKVVRSSAGGVFLVPVVTATTSEALATAGESGLRRLAADATAGEPYDRVDLTVAIALVIGNEAHGLPTAVGPLVDGHVHIPVVGRAESLNAAMAASILVFEAAGQRRRSHTEIARTEP